MNGSELRNVKVVVVAFRLKEDRSVAYKKFEIPSDSELGAFINEAIHEKKADFLSIRAVEACR